MFFNYVANLGIKIDISKNINVFFVENLVQQKKNCIFADDYSKK